MIDLAPAVDVGTIATIQFVVVLTMSFVVLAVDSVVGRIRINRHALDLRIAYKKGHRDGYDEGYGDGKIAEAEYHEVSEEQ